MTELRSGLLVADTAITLAVQLEARGHVLTAEAGVLKVSDGARLTADDTAAIRKWRFQLLAIAGGEA